MKNSETNLLISVSLAVALMFGGNNVWGSGADEMEEVVDAEEPVVAVVAGPVLLKPVTIDVADDQAQSGCSVFCAGLRDGLNAAAEYAVEPGLQVGLKTLKNLAEQLKIDPDIANKPQVVLAFEGVEAGIDLLVDAINAVRIVKSVGEEDKADAAAEQAIEFGKKVTAKIAELSEDDDGSLQAVLSFMGSLFEISETIATAEPAQRVTTAISEVITLSFAIKNLVVYMQKHERDLFVVDTANIAGRKNKEAMVGRNHARLAKIRAATAETVLIKDAVKGEFTLEEWAAGKAKAKHDNLFIDLG